MNLAKVKNKKAIIFDMDGTLVDSIPYHKEAWLTFLRKHNILLTPEDFLAQNHGNIDEMIRRFFGYDLPYEQIKVLGWEREEIFKDLYSPHIKEIEGLTILLTKMDKMNIKASLATMGNDMNIDQVIDGLNVRKNFHSFIAA